MEQARTARRRRRVLGRFDARRGAACLCGVDEVGRGPLAGPVVAAAVILEPGARLVGIDDSKRVAPALRAELATTVEAQARACAVAEIASDEIDRINIRQATFAAMRQAIDALTIAPDLVLVDGDPIPDLACAQEPVVGGDGRSLAIACASVVAKVWRDRRMLHYDQLYPDYGFASHKGYATADHLRALTRFGPSPIHRLSFAPVRLAAQTVLL